MIRWLSCLLFLLSSHSAFAWGWYFEFGAGLAQVSQPTPLLPEARGNLSTALQVPMTVAIALQEGQSPPIFHLGISQRYFQGSAPTATPGVEATFKTLTTYPVIRMEIWRFVLGAGYTPWVWKDFTYARNSATALLLEGSFLLPISPEIDFGLNLATQRFNTRSGSGPTTMEYGVFFRLNYGMTEANQAARRNYKGWRYPFGTYKGN